MKTTSKKWGKNEDDLKKNKKEYDLKKENLNFFLRNKDDLKKNKK
jgi:hypothetical protein